MHIALKCFHFSENCSCIAKFHRKGPLDVAYLVTLTRRNFLMWCLEKISWHLALIFGYIYRRGLRGNMLVHQEIWTRCLNKMLHLSPIISWSLVPSSIGNGCQNFEALHWVSWSWCYIRDAFITGIFPRLLVCWGISDKQQTWYCLTNILV